MFSFFNKEPFKVVACVSGKCIMLEEVNDQVFSTKMLGDGFAIIPSTSEFVSPVTGTIETVFPTKHAFGIKTKDGVEILVHIGLDTVNLKGEGFTSLIKAGDKVKAGQTVMKLDLSFFKQNSIDLTTMIIFTSGYDKEVTLTHYGEVKANEILIG